jgi:hypothetical protein
VKARVCSLVYTLEAFFCANAAFWLLAQLSNFTEKPLASPNAFYGESKCEQEYRGDSNQD